MEFGAYNPETRTYVSRHKSGLLSVAATTLSDILGVVRLGAGHTVEHIEWPAEKHDNWNTPDGVSRNVYDLYFRTIDRGVVAWPSTTLYHWIGDCSTYEFAKLRPYVDTYFNLSEAVLERRSWFMRKYNIVLNGTIGVMYRGTDKSSEAPRIEPSEYLKYIRAIPAYKQYRILLVTDDAYAVQYLCKAEQPVVELFRPKQYYPLDHFLYEPPRTCQAPTVINPVFVLDEMPVSNGHDAMHNVKDKTISNYELGINYLAAVSILSTCKYFIADGVSNASLWMYLYRGHADNTVQIHPEFGKGLRVYNNIK